MIQKSRDFPLLPPAFAGACLAAGYALNGHWLALPLIGLWLLAWWLVRRNPSPWVAPLLLTAAVCFAGYGVLAGAPFLLMILSTAAALAGWDLFLTEPADRSPQMQPGSRLWNRRVQSLAFAVTLGAVSAIIGSMIRLQIPFALMLLLVVLAFAALDRVMRGLKSQNTGQ